MRENVATPEGRALGAELARLCDREAEIRGRDERCATCAFRAGDHLANGSPETLMTALKCAAERTPFWCHEEEKPCAGWQLMRFPAAGTVTVPWDCIEGADDVDSITGCADDQTWADVPVDALRNALAAGTRSAETGETPAPSVGCQSGPKGNAQEVPSNTKGPPHSPREQEG